MALTRELIRAGWIQDMVKAAGHPVRALSEEELHRSRETALALHEPGHDLALFAYGSLIWNPAIEYARRELARLNGFHRRFCLWTHLGRGTPERPGLVLGLDSGGSCRGVVYWIAADAIESELEILWRREMVTGAYRPAWVTVQAESGPSRALTFLMNRHYERYAGRLSEEATVAAIATAAGPLGPCADYLFNTTAHLDQLGIADRTLRRLCRAVRAYQEGARPTSALDRPDDPAGALAPT
jgi:cation transport protein ChaC